MIQVESDDHIAGCQSPPVIVTLKLDFDPMSDYEIGIWHNSI